VKLQTTVLTLVQWIPLFILPYFVLPYLGSNGFFTHGGIGQWFGETFLSNGPGTAPDQYWRAFGFILAWPLFVFNLFTDAPLWGWLILGFIQTFVIIPLIVWRWGKGAYCGWICSCGALAETMGDAHRQKMPHGPFWNKLNMVGQVVLAFAFVILAVRIIGWVFPDSGINPLFKTLLYTLPIGNYSYLVDLWLAGVMGVAFYFHFSGRVWCRFACPLAALMHIYGRFTRFRIFAD
jgi:polyferredoxin